MGDDVPVTAVSATDRGLPARKLGEPPWEACYAAVYAVAVVIVEAARLGPRDRITASAALAAMLLWYLWAGRPLKRRADAGRAPSTLAVSVFLTVLTGLFAVVQSKDTNAWFLGFALVPICLRITTVRLGMAFVALFNGVAALLVSLRYPGLASGVVALGDAVLSIGLAYVFSRWVRLVVAQSEERAALIEQLESTRAELAAAHHEAGVLAERHRLAGEIHDTLAQGFTSIVTLVQAAVAGLEPGDPAQGHLGLALETARENLAEARTLVTALSPAGLDEGGLGDALRRAAESAAAGGGVRARAEVSGTRRQLPTGTEVVLLRVCQEALANVRRHAAAAQVDVRLRYAAGSVELTVADDGRGFDKTAVNGGYGLRGMRDRVRQAGGTIEVATLPGAGTVVRAEVPG